MCSMWLKILLFYYLDKFLMEVYLFEPISGFKDQYGVYGPGASSMTLFSL